MEVAYRRDQAQFWAARDLMLALDAFLALKTDDHPRLAQHAVSAADLRDDLQRTCDHITAVWN